MGKSKLTVTHPDVTYESLNECLQRQPSARIGLRISILQDVIKSVPIKELSSCRNISRQGIYDLVKRVNEDGMKALQTDPGRPSKLTAEIENDLRETLLQSPANRGYRQPCWNNSLLRKYLQRKYNIHISYPCLTDWLRNMGAPGSLVRKNYRRADCIVLQKVA